jgi:hypothetical protein
MFLHCVHCIATHTYAVFAESNACIYMYEVDNVFIFT